MTGNGPWPKYDLVKCDKCNHSWNHHSDDLMGPCYARDRKDKQCKCEHFYKDEFGDLIEGLRKSEINNKKV